MKLTPRLETIAAMVPSNCRVGDVGSDHGYLVASLVESGKVVKAIASDVNQGPVDNALSTLKELGLTEQIDLRLGGGLEPYEAGEIDVAVIAGMGGMLIREIIEQSIELAKSLDFLILQPMTQQPELRRWLAENGFEVFDERNVREGSKYYELFCIRSGQMVVKDTIEFEIGFNRDLAQMEASQRKAYVEFLEHKLKKYQKIEREILHKGSENAAEALALVAEKIEKIKGVLADVRQRQEHI